MKIAYLGPAGTFTEMAALVYSSSSETVPYDTIEDVIFAVDKGEIPLGVVPIENSTEGTVNTTIDLLLFDVVLKIVGEITLPVEHNLMVKQEFINSPIKEILSHPQALSQCRNFIRENYPNSYKKPVPSTSLAAKIVSESTSAIASISTVLAAEIYGLTLKDKNIQDEIKNETKFVVLSKNNNQQYSGSYKTSIAFTTFNKPGELYKILDIFNLWDLNMTKIVSRPMKHAMGEYIFFVDIDGSITDDLKDAITMIKRKTAFFKIIGSYPILGTVKKMR